MDKTEALLKHMRDLAAWLEIQAQDFDNGDAHHYNGGQDDSADAAANYRHRLRNIVAVVQAYNRLTGREEIRQETSESAEHGVPLPIKRHG
jgi:hypothetical protein